ncbi:ephrin type-B receptor 2-like isoform X2 [Mya arenaria]|uniref:ephrin type-B receptor 2-like isoform X2 n=1 Tax=Mya arenaria TaxID=6604 RepID=UPI0022E60B6C|nr:ephrin type-B receptor 2-like isoform X2 [Mya arenaria]
MASDIDQEKCGKHGSEYVFFCKKHANVGCGKCHLKEHATCGQDIVDLDDITKENVDTKLANRLRRSITDMSDNILQIEENLSGSQSRNKTSKEACLRELNAYKKKIVDRIEKQTKNAKDAVTDMYNKGEEDIKIVSAACSELKQKITSKKTDFEASIRNNQYKKQYILMTTLKKELETLTSEVEELKQRSITEPITLVCNIDVEKWFEDKGSDFIVKRASDRLDANESKPPPLPPRPIRYNPALECSSDIDGKPDCGEIRLDEIVSCVRIGQGHFNDFAKVFKGFCKPMNVNVVVKVYKRKCTDSMRQAFATHMAALRTLDHPNLVKYLGIVFESQPIGIVMEYVSGQCLLDNLRSINNKQTTIEAARMCLDIATGMEYLIAHGCSHKTLAARNCFITNDCVVKISDYGIYGVATSLTDKLPSGPDNTRKGERPTEESNVWSYGVVIWEIFSRGAKPNFERYFRNKEFLPVSRSIPDSIYHLMKRCCAFDSKERFLFTDILRQLRRLIENPPSTEKWN